MNADCKDALEKAHLFLDGEVLSETERAEIQRHLEECGPCYERVGLEKEITDMIARLKGATPCPKALRVRIQAQIQGS